MTNNNTRKYLITVSVNTETLVESYRDNTDVREDKDLPSLEDIILNSCNWLDPDGIQALEVEEIENKDYSQMPRCPHCFQIMENN